MGRNRIVGFAVSCAVSLCLLLHQAAAEDPIPGACKFDSGYPLTELLDRPGFARTADLSDCTGNQIDMNACMQYKYWVSEQGLRDILLSIDKSHYDAKLRAGFLSAQESWCTYRDQACTYDSSKYDGGSAKGWFFNECLVNFNRRRTSELNDYLTHLGDGPDAQRLYNYETR